MSPLAIFDRLADLGAVTYVSNGRLRIDAPTGAVTPELAEAIKANRDTLVAAVIGRATGHALAPCTTCGDVSMVSIDRDDKGPACRMTPGCDGRHEPRAADLPAIKKVPRPKQAAPPRNHGKARKLGESIAYPTGQAS